MGEIVGSKPLPDSSRPRRGRDPNRCPPSQDSPGPKQSVGRWNIILLKGPWSTGSLANTAWEGALQGRKARQASVWLVVGKKGQLCSGAPRIGFPASQASSGRATRAWSGSLRPNCSTGPGESLQPTAVLRGKRAPLPLPPLGGGERLSAPADRLGPTEPSAPGRKIDPFCQEPFTTAFEQHLARPSLSFPHLATKYNKSRKTIKRSPPPPFK